MKRNTWLIVLVVGLVALVAAGYYIAQQQPKLMFQQQKPMFTLYGLDGEELDIDQELL